jgi:hypothetical protein
MSPIVRKSFCCLLFLSSAASAAPPSLPAAPSSPISGWCQAWPDVIRPVHAALEEALDSLSRGWGPDSHGLGYPLHQSLLPLAARLPVPDARLDRQLRQTLFLLEEGAQACMKSMPMTTRLRLVDGARALAGLESSLAAASPGCASACPAPGCRSAAAALSVLIGQEEEAGATLPGGGPLPTGRPGLVVAGAGAAPALRPEPEPEAKPKAKLGRKPKKPSAAKPRPHRSCR